MRIAHKWLGKLGVQNWIGYDDADRPTHHRNIRQLAHNDLIEEAINLAAENAALKAELVGGTEAVDEHIQTMHDLCEGDPDTDERIIGACHARSAMFRGQEAARAALASPTETAKEGVDG